MGITYCFPQPIKKKTKMENVQENELDDVGTTSLNIAGMVNDLLPRRLSDLRGMAATLGVENDNRL